LIELRNGEIIKSTISEISKKEVVYKKFENPKGPNYRMNVNEIAEIRYENGAVDILNPKASGEMHNSVLFGDVPRVSANDMGDNALFIDMFDLAFQRVHISYERFLGQSKMYSIRVPVMINMLPINNSTNMFNNFYNAGYTGISFNFYPFGLRNSSFVIGPEIRLGYSTITESIDVYDPNGNFLYFEEKYVNSGYTSFLVNGGFSWNPTNKLTFLSTFGLGTQRSFRTNSYGIGPAASFRFMVGYRF
jgi:hypothetical protein